MKLLTQTLLTSLALTYTGAALAATDSGKIYYHLTFPVSISSQTENIDLNNNYKDLILTNFVAGALYVHLIHEHFPHLRFDRQYMEGSLLAQLLQENLQTSDYQAASDWINPNEAIRNMLLASGQGGPYQINDYSKRLENKLGMINFTALQKSLGYTIQEQDSGAQTLKKGPVSLDNKYFGPLAAAYFQYNDLLRLQSINQDPWGPSAAYFPSCMTNLENTPDNFLDMIQNAAYNAGPWSDINKTYIKLCGNYKDPAYASQIQHLNDYTLNDLQYQQAVGTMESPGSTFILYPRQIRFYLDELYNNPTVLQTHNSLSFELSQLKLVFVNSMSTLAYVNSSGAYVFISKQDANTAFDKALSQLALSETASLDISDKNNRNQFFDLLELSISNLSSALNITFSDVTEENH